MKALVTGGGRGIGAGIARALAGDGWEVVVGAGSRAQVEAVAAEIGGESVEVDVSDRGSVERAVAEAGELDLLVANAGVSGVISGGRLGRSMSMTGGTSTRSTFWAFTSAAAP
jgi:NAD(P)-dependent dehydrogenase (short-subunit alcohol dehydrogenase family)